MIINTRNFLSALLALVLLTGSVCAAQAGTRGAAGYNSDTLVADTHGHGEGRGDSDAGHKRFAGRVKMIRSNIVTVVQTNGTVQTFTLTPVQVQTVRVGEEIILVTTPTSPFVVTQVMPAPLLVTSLPIIGLVQLISGNVATLLLDNGLTQTFTLTPVEEETVNVGERVVLFRSSAQPMVITRVVPAVQTVRGVLVSATKTTVVVRLPNGALRTITVAPEAAINMRHREGRPVIVRTRTAFTRPVSVREILVR